MSNTNTNERALTHLLVAGVGWIPVDGGKITVLKDPARYQWEAEGCLLTINEPAIVGSKRAKR